MSITHKFFTEKKPELWKRPVEKASTSTLSTFYHVAVQGCSHGELHSIYDACTAHEQQSGKKIDLLICCGDFQCIRNRKDLVSMVISSKYRKVGDFSEYYSNVSTGNFAENAEMDNGTQPLYRQAPYLTVFIGGNHENSDWLAEESYGGFVAPNIYYLGHSGVIVVDGLLCIAGLSGIFNVFDYDKPYPPRPYWQREDSKRSAYHVRRIEAEKLRVFFTILRYEQEKRCRKGPLFCGSDKEPSLCKFPRVEEFTDYPLQVDVVVSHDWPAGITKYGNEEQLLRYKPFLKKDVAHNTLGNPHTLALLRLAQPRHWFAAHLHCFFQAKILHCESGVKDGANTHVTTFTALDKCAKRKGFIDFFDLPIVQGCQTLRRSVSVPPGAGPFTDAKLHCCDFVGMDRIIRHPVWVNILKASHPYVANNKCTTTAATSHEETRGKTGEGIYNGDGAGGSDVTGFHVDQVLHSWKNEQPGQFDVRLKEWRDKGVLGAPTTSALLAVLQLQPVEPLQSQERRVDCNPCSSSVTAICADCSEEKAGSAIARLDEAHQTQIVSERETLGWSEDLRPS